MAMCDHRLRIKKVKSICENCANYVYDDEYDCYCCQADLDEDDVQRLFVSGNRECPYFNFYDEYSVVRKQN